jgi:hypothetical protein
MVTILLSPIFMTMATESAGTLVKMMTTATLVNTTLVCSLKISSFATLEALLMSIIIACKDGFSFNVEPDLQNANYATRRADGTWAAYRFAWAANGNSLCGFAQFGTCFTYDLWARNYGCSDTSWSGKFSTARIGFNLNTDLESCA